MPKLLVRHSGNPILTAADWPYPAHTIFNPGATRMPNGDTLLLCRVEDFRGHSHLCAARSKNGIDGWVIDAEPTLYPSVSEHPEELWGIEDPRITYVPELSRFVVAYTAYTREGPGVALALTTDFKTFERLGLVMQPDDKDAALLPRRVNGEFALVHRPAHPGGGHIWISYSPDLRNWGNHQLMLHARKGAWWDANKIGLSPPLIETNRGWLMLYHGVRLTAAGALYRLGLALFALDEPSRCIARGQPWLFGPETDYERNGDVGYVTFPCGYVIQDDGDTIYIYYGAADTSVALAIASVNELLQWLDDHGEPPTASQAPPS